MRYADAVSGLTPAIDVAFIPALTTAPLWAAEALDDEERARWEGLHATGRPLFLAAHLGVRQLAARRLGVDDIRAFGWITGPSGKPALTFRDARPMPLHISVSHGGGLAVAAVCDHGPIGVDVEHVNRPRDVLAIARRFFSSEEHETLVTGDPDVRAPLFHQWWTRKEAVLKATGTGLRGGLDVRVDGEPDADGWRRVTVPGQASLLYVRDLAGPAPDVVGAVAIASHPASLRIVGDLLT